MKNLDDNIDKIEGIKSRYLIKNLDTLHSILDINWVQQNLKSSQGEILHFNSICVWCSKWLRMGNFQTPKCLLTFVGFEC